MSKYASLKDGIHGLTLTEVPLAAWQKTSPADGGVVVNELDPT
jgi:hypothetical protein